MDYAGWELGTKLSYDKNQLSHLAGNYHVGQCGLSACYISGRMLWTEDGEQMENPVGFKVISPIGEESSITLIMTQCRNC